MKTPILCAFLIALISINSFSQTSQRLSKEFHAERRALLRAKMPKNSVALVFANPIRNRANDVDFVYHQDPNFYYLTGYKEPNAVLVVFSENQTNAIGETYNEILYVQERDAKAEMWNGKRLGIEGATSQLGFTQVFNAIDFVNSTIDYKSFDNVFTEKFKDDYRNSSNNGAEIFDLVKSFKVNAGYDPKMFLSRAKKYVYEMIKATPIENSANVAQIIGRIENQYAEIKEDVLLMQYKVTEDAALKKEVQQKVILQLNIKTPINVDFLSDTLGAMREVKTTEELKLLTKAIRISAIGQIEVMKAMHPQMSEMEVQGIHEFVYKKYGASYEGYPSIVGAGNNGCILHYIENDKEVIGNDLILMDLGAEYGGYSADVTRTIPANGKFSKEQKAVYKVVLKAQDAGIAESVVGNSFSAPGNVAREEINKGLVALGILKSLDEKHAYFPHGTSHYLGLDVHDPGTYGTFQENTVITVEPGIYIPDGSPCDKKWWGIAVRIEDDILITKKGPINLSEEAPRAVKAIEKMMRNKSVLDDFLLPNLDE